MVYSDIINLRLTDVNDASQKFADWRHYLCGNSPESNMYKIDQAIGDLRIRPAYQVQQFGDGLQLNRDGILSVSDEFNQKITTAEADIAGLKGFDEDIKALPSYRIQAIKHGISLNDNGDLVIADSVISSLVSLLQNAVYKDSQSAETQLESLRLELTT